MGGEQSKGTTQAPRRVCESTVLSTFLIAALATAYEATALARRSDIANSL